jgi:hypothetical protein
MVIANLAQPPDCRITLLQRNPLSTSESLRSGVGRKNNFTPWLDVVSNNVFGQQDNNEAVPALHNFPHSQELSVHLQDSIDGHVLSASQVGEMEDNASVCNPHGRA